MTLLAMLSTYRSTNAGAAATIDTRTATAATTPLPARVGAGTAGVAATTVRAGSDVVISDAAKAAAAAKADNAKDILSLSKEVRATLDRRYGAGAAKASPDLSGMSGRGLAAIALDKTGGFSAAEVAAAKTTLRDQTRTGFTKAMASGGGIAGLAAYSRQVVAAYDGMSSEERQARGWTDAFRASNATFVGTASMPSLFDHFD